MSERLPVPVTDHAVLRWLERACGVDVEAVREAISGCCDRGVEAEAKIIVVDRVKFIAVDGVIVTTLHRRMRVHPGQKSGSASKGRQRK
ncbi:MAG: hypothetical protein COA37_17755 [Hoeflea sp.]|uniref:hypothetical protein n=1 Tax=Hoeflea sp. TaxID=1940281 RepID=UPI000C0E3586|nr:hypothetical protein [Hoeflea sp.]PHR19276.1 MAG: hypothetical protein COA37_17755 [Hoeflea sp.]